MLKIKYLLLGYFILNCHNLILASDQFGRITGYRDQAAVYNNINIHIGFKDILSGLKEIASDKQNKFQDWANAQPVNFKNWLINHKYLVGTSSLLVIYCYISHKISLCKQVLYSNHSWSNWQISLSLGELISKPTNLIYRELYSAILDQYHSYKNQDSIAPILMFNIDINQEINALQKFCALTNKLQTMRLNKLFYISQQDLNLAQEKINRLLYLKKVISDSIKISLNN